MFASRYSVSIRSYVWPKPVILRDPIVHVTVGAMSRSAQPSGLGNHALVRWSKRTPCMRMRDGLRVALLAGCSACAVRVSCAWRVSFLSPQLLAFVRLDICSMPVFRCHGLYAWATHGIIMP